MNSKLSPFILRYKEFLQSEKYDEQYKWKAFQYFQDNWSDDHTAENIASNLERSFDRPNNNLWSGSHFLPYKMILQFVYNSPKLCHAVRPCYAIFEGA